MIFFVEDLIVDLTDEAVNDVVVFTLLHIPKDNQLAVRTAKIIFHLMHQCAVQVLHFYDNVTVAFVFHMKYVQI